MEQSIYITWVTKYFPGIVLSIINKLNGTTGPNGQPIPSSYLHQTMLQEDYSVSGKWESVAGMFTTVMADIVSMDSELPLKSRDSISQASGDIPKMGMEMYLTESQLSALDTIIARGGTESQISQKLFADTIRCIVGVYERNEAIFLRGLSTGYALVDDSENVGVGVRLDYKYLTANKFGVAALWSNPTTAKPLDDLKKLTDKAKTDGVAISQFLMDPITLGFLAQSTQVKEAYAFMQGYTGGNIPTPDSEQVNTLLTRKFKATVLEISRSMRYEKNGTFYTYKPWQEGIVIGLITNDVGSLVYATLAEENHKVNGVTYEKAGSYILVSKYRQNKPSLTEVTSSQARVFPVISGVDNIYQLDTKTLQA